jgi:hypothetical protein
MSTNLQDLLREGLDRLTAGATVPDELVSRAQRRNRQRRIKIRAAIAAGTAVAAAAAVTVSLAATGNQPRSAPVHTQTIADVVTRTERALASAASKGNAIQVTQLTGRNVTFGLTVVGPNGVLGSPSPAQRLPGARAAVSAQRMVSWTYRDLWLQEGFSATGRLVFVNVNGPITLHSGKHVAGNYGAAYPVHIRWRSVSTGESGPAFRLTCQDVFPSAYPSWRATISKALSCGLFHLSGRQWVDGVDAMPLVSQPRGAGFRVTLWVDPSTYLPVRMSATFLSGSDRGQQFVTDFRFLPPTRANLAALHAAERRAPIPATFRLLPQKYTVLAGGV